MQKINIINQLVNNENVYNWKMIKVDKVWDVYFKSFNRKKTKKIKVNLVITPKWYSLEKIWSTMQQIVIFYKFVWNDLTHFDTKFKAYFKDVHFPTMQELFSAMEDVIISSKTEETDNWIKVMFHTWYNDYNSWDVVYLSEDNYDEIRSLWEFVVKYEEFNKLCEKVEKILWCNKKVYNNLVSREKYKEVMKKVPKSSMKSYSTMMKAYKKIWILDYVKDWKDYHFYNNKSWWRAFIWNWQKYREDNFNPINKIEELEKKIKELEKWLDDVGVYNTKKEYNQARELLNFYKKYESNPRFNLLKDIEYYKKDIITHKKYADKDISQLLETLKRYKITDKEEINFILNYVKDCNDINKIKVIFYSNFKKYKIWDIECITLDKFDKLREEDVCMELEKFKYFCMGENNDNIEQEKNKECEKYDGDISFWNEIKLYGREYVAIKEKSSMYDESFVYVDKKTKCILKTSDGEKITYIDDDTKSYDFCWKKYHYIDLDDKFKGLWNIFVDEKFNILKTSDGNIITNLNDTYEVWKVKIWVVEIENNWDNEIEEVVVDENLKVLKLDNKRIVGIVGEKKKIKWQEAIKVVLEDWTNAYVYINSEWKISKVFETEKEKLF